MVCKHDRVLEDIIRKPHIVGLNKTQIDFMLSEPIWLEKWENDYKKMPDLLVGYQDLTIGTIGIPLEIKASVSGREKAIIQLCSGKEFLEDYIKAKVNKGIIVYYSKGLIYENICL